jgi:bifunctional DNA-binding transcriptional regulator/antitoxin component of YhaV-PrlF toxin-antitoxin module
MATDKIHLVHVDNKGRLVLPKGARTSELYALEVMENNEIILRPRVAVDPNTVINKKTLGVLDEAIKTLAKGQAGKPIDLSGFKGEEEAVEQEGKVRQKKSRRR